MSEIKKENKLLSPKLDAIFQVIFGEVGSERITKEFIETILGREVGEIDLSKNQILKRELKEEKLGILDVLVEIEGKEKCNLEMQVANQADILDRILFYWAKLFTKGFRAGENYGKLKKTIVVLIANFEIKGLERLKYHTKWELTEEKERKYILTDKEEIHILELPKIKGKEKEDDDLLDWLFFLEDPQGERVKKRMEEKEELKEAVTKLQQVSDDERMQRIAELREKALHDEASIKETALQEGLQEGLQKGLQQGLQKGENKAKEEIAKKMLKEKLEISLIGKLTGLSEEEIRKLED